MKSGENIESQRVSLFFFSPSLRLSLSLFLSFSSLLLLFVSPTMDAYEKLEKIGEGTYGKVGDERGGEERKKKCRPRRRSSFVARIALSPSSRLSFSSSLTSLFSLSLSLFNHTLMTLTGL